ncbi:MAG: D-alanine--D-alanine ligase [Proteobacteria bacterium]|jgi:hypothetical protein|nr:D-alanine--D-alanine ligase [Pseudomonadota bacterium]
MITGQSNTAVTSEAYVSPGMPSLKETDSAVSFFEFWPTWLMYMPVVFSWLILSLRHLSLSLPLIANPRIPNSGMVGFSKNDVLIQGDEHSQKYILPWITYTVTDHPLDQQVDLIMSRLAESGLKLPIVGKPDMGCRGAGVNLLNDKNDVTNYLRHYSIGGVFMLQRLADWEPEAGIFYVKLPDENTGRITSIALKYTPYVLGDGEKTLSELIKADPRAGRVTHLYENRHKSLMDQIIPRDEPFRLVFAASHCRGAVFTDGRIYITDALSQKIDEIMSGFPEFYYGRLDIKFKGIDQLIRGEDITIIEVNGASSEALHIWDKDTNLSEAWKSLIWQYRILFKIGAANRTRGHKPPGIRSLLSAWLHEKNLSTQYPQTD